MGRSHRARMRDLYDQVPNANCQGHCTDSCGPIEMSQFERAMIERRGVQITGRHEAMQRLLDGEAYDCEALVDGQCSVYSDRPMICRVWGVTPILKCPYGCEPDAMLPDPDAYALINESIRIGGSPAGWGVMPPSDLIRQWAVENSGLMAEFHAAIKPKDRR